MEGLPDFDARIRNAVAELLLQSPDMARLGAEPAAPWLWTVTPEAAARRERISLPFHPYGLNDWLHGEDSPGTNLPLSQARVLVADAAGALAAIGHLATTQDPQTRRAGIGPLARACAERASTVCWVLANDDEDERLKRSLLVELDGVNRLLNLLPHTRRTGDVTDVEQARTAFLRVAEERFGSCETSDRGVTSIDGLRVPSLTKRVTDATSAQGYAELNVFTHPTGHAVAAHTQTAAVEFGQVAWVPVSTLHEEGRLIEPAVLAFAKSAEVVVSTSEVRPLRAFASGSWG